MLYEALFGAVVASACSFFGAITPLLFGLLLPGQPLLGLGLTISLLGVLGALLAWSTFGSPIVWSLAMMAGGIVLTVIGVQLDIVG